MLVCHASEKKTGPSVTSAFQSVLKDPKYSKYIRRPPVWVQTDRGTEFLNRPFQDILKREGISSTCAGTLT